MKRKPAASKPGAPASQRILIVDDHQFVRLGLGEALGRTPGLCVCGAFGTAEEALEAVEKLDPDVVLTDLKLPGKSGLELIKDLARLRPELPVIVLSMYDEEHYAERCLRAGARGYVTKSEGSETMALAIRKVLAGGIHVSEKTSARILAALSGRPTDDEQSPISRLTDREFDVFQWIARGLPTEEIAHHLHVSVKTVETHRIHIKEKLGFATAGELIAYAAEWMAAQG